MYRATRQARRMQVLEAPGASGEGRSSDKEAESNFPLLHATETSITLPRHTSRKLEIYIIQNVQSQTVRMSDATTEDSRGHRRRGKEE